MANETKANCRGPTTEDAKSEPDESSYMLRDKRPSPSIIQQYQHTRQERHHRIFDDSWAWYVVGGCAFANFLLPGMLRSFGPDVLDGFVEVHELEFPNRSVFSCRWIPATFNLTFFIAGSLSCLLCKLISHRAVAFCGGLLASAGMMFCSFANSISHLYISYGVMVGFGAGLCYSAGILIVNEYFDKHRGLANGLSLAGTAVGALAMPPYLDFLTFSYGYRGGILIVSGMMLNTLTCSITYKPAIDGADGIVQQDEVTCTRVIATSATTPTSINARGVTTTAFRAATDLYYAAVVSSPLLKSKTVVAAASSTDDEDNDEDEDDEDDEHLKNTRWRRWLKWRHPNFGGTPVAEFLAVSAVHTISHLAYATAAPARAATLQLAAAEAAGRFLAPTASDMLSPGGSASIYLYAAVVAVGGTVLLIGATAGSDADPFQWPLQSSVDAQWLAFLIVAFGLASGAAVGLEPLVAVRALGREQLSNSCSATLLGKGAAQLAVDLFLRRPPSGNSTPGRGGHWPPISPCVFYALGSVLVATAAAWTAVFLFKRHYASKTGCSRYVRTA